MASRFWNVISEHDLEIITVGEKEELKEKGKGSEKKSRDALNISFKSFNYLNINALKWALCTYFWKAVQLFLFLCNIRLTKTSFYTSNFFSFSFYFFFNVYIERSFFKKNYKDQS